jgi:hypothetical protein
MSNAPLHNRKWLWSQKSDYARLQREVKSFEIELNFLIARYGKEITLGQKLPEPK